MVVRVTVAAAGVGAVCAVVCAACAEASVAALRKMARDRFFTRFSVFFTKFSVWGRSVSYETLNLRSRGVGGTRTGRTMRGWDFGHRGAGLQASLRDAVRCFVVYPASELAGYCQRSLRDLSQSFLLGGEGGEGGGFAEVDAEGAFFTGVCEGYFEGVGRLGNLVGFHLGAGEVLFFVVGGAGGDVFVDD